MVEFLSNLNNIKIKLICSVSNVAKPKYQTPVAWTFERKHTPIILRFCLFKSKETFDYF